MPISKNIETIISEGEGYLIEFKESFINLAREISAFANASGGTIYLGVSDSGKIKETPLNNRLKAQIQSDVRSLDPPPLISLEQYGPVVAIHVRESTNKPVRAPNGFYLRIGASSQKLSREEIFAFAVKETKIRFDSQLFIDSQAQDILDPQAIRRFREKAQLDTNMDSMVLLENLGCIQTQHQIAYATHAAILCFARNPQSLFPQSTLTLLHMEDTSTIREQKIVRGTLFSQVDEAFHFLRDHLRVTTTIRSLEREESLEIPEAILRELIVNAVVHRDYFEPSADVVIKLFRTHIEFSNPGKVSDHMPIRSIFGRSFRRNPLIADLFYRIRYIERAGTGLLRVQNLLAQSGLPKLKLEEEGPFFIATLQRRNETSIRLNERQNRLLTLPKHFFPFSTTTYATQFKISDRLARLDIQHLIRSKLLITQRHGRHIRYTLRGS